MGLDSVELLISFEKAFGIDVPDYDAEQLATVGDVTTWFHKHLTNSNTESIIQKEIRQRIYNSVKAIGLDEDFDIYNSISSVFKHSDLPELWRKFEVEINLEIPKLNRFDLHLNGTKRSNFVDRLFSWERPAVTSHNFERLTEWIGALNYNKFLEPKKAKTVFDVLIVVIFLTHDNCGVNIDEIFWNSSFTSDLGID